MQSSAFSIIDTGKASTSFLYCDNEIIPGLFTCEQNWFSYITTITNTQTGETYLYNGRSEKWIAKNVLSITNVKVNSNYGIITYQNPTDGFSIYMYTTGNVPYIPPAEFGKFLKAAEIEHSNYLMVFEHEIITVAYSQFRAIGYSLGKEEVADFYYTLYNVILKMQNGDIIVLDNSAKAAAYSRCSLSVFNNNYNSPIYAIRANNLYYFYNAESKFLFSTELLLMHWEINDTVMTIQHHYYYYIEINIETGEMLKKYTLPTNETNHTIHVGESFSLINYNDEVLEIPVVINIAKISDNRTLILYCKNGFYLYDLVEQKIILQIKGNF